ncbi:MAG TPA: hypothetical protein VIT67_07455 [Povalibacter sp.]
MPDRVDRKLHRDLSGWIERRGCGNLGVAICCSLALKRGVRRRRRSLRGQLPEPNGYRCIADCKHRASDRMLQVDAGEGTTDHKAYRNHGNYPQRYRAKEPIPASYAEKHANRKDCRPQAQEDNEPCKWLQQRIRLNLRNSKDADRANSAQCCERQKHDTSQYLRPPWKTRLGGM